MPRSGPRQEGGAILASRSTTIPTTASQAELIARLQAAPGLLEHGAIPGSLREHGVDALVFDVEQDGRFRVLLDGLDNAYRPGMEIEGRGWLETDPSGKPVIYFEVRPRSSSIWTGAIVTAFLLGVAGYNLLVLDPPNRFAYIVFLFAPLFLVWDWMQVRMLTDRVWQGLLVVLKRLAANQVAAP